MIIDSHTHVDKVSEPEDLIKSMDDAAIDYSIIIADGKDGAGSSIESLLKSAQKYDKLGIVGDVDFSTFDLSQINYLIDLMDKEKILGVKFYLGYEEYYPSNERLHPIYQYCQENGKPVIFHTGALESGNRGLLKYSHPLNIDEVANLFPKLKIVMAHMGNPWLLDCAAVLFKNENVYADMSGFFEENSTIGHEEIEIFINRLSDAWLFLGSYEKFMFGTDYPLYSQREYLQAVQSLNLTKEEKDHVFWKNAKKIFNLKF